MSDTPEHKPFVPPEQSPRELTARALIMGAALGLVFAASSVYLGLKVGLTASDRRLGVSYEARSEGIVLLGVADVAGKYYIPWAGAFIIYALMVVVLIVRPEGLFARARS